MRDVHGLPLDEIVFRLVLVTENIEVVVFVTELELEYVKYPDVDGVSLIEILEVDELEDV